MKSCLYRLSIRVLCCGFVLLTVAATVSAQWTSCSNGSTTCTVSHVGIGTTSPQDLIDFYGNSQNTTGRLFSGNTGKFSYFAVGRTGDELEIGVAASAAQFFNDTVPGVDVLKSYGPLMIGVGDAHPTITVTNGGQNPGNVGIGTTNLSIHCQSTELFKPKKSL